MQNFVLLVITLSTQNNIKLLKQLESDFKKLINWNKYHSKKRQAQNEYLDFLIFPKISRKFSFYHLIMMMVEKVRSKIILHYIKMLR